MEVHRQWRGVQHVARETTLENCFREKRPSGDRYYLFILVFICLGYISGKRVKRPTVLLHIW